MPLYAGRRFRERSDKMPPHHPDFFGRDADYREQKGFRRFPERKREQSRVSFRQAANCWIPMPANQRCRYRVPRVTDFALATRRTSLRQRELPDKPTLARVRLRLAFAKRSIVRTQRKSAGRARPPTDNAP